jgi:hypothetical protein
MKNKVLSVIGMLALSTMSNTLSASEVGANHVVYENGKGMEYFAKIDIKYGVRANVSYTNMNMDNFSMLGVSKGSALDMNYFKYGIGYYYNIFSGMELYLNANKARLETGDVTVELNVGEEKEEVIIPIEDIEGYEYDLGLRYRFLKSFEIDLSGKKIKYDNLDDIDTYSGTLSYYFTERFKINATYTENSFINEPVYNVGISFNF